MEREEIIEQLKTILKPYVQDEEAYSRITESSDLLRDLKINSAHLVDVVLDVETEFNIQVDDEAMEKMVTVRDAVDIIQAKLA